MHAWKKQYKEEDARKKGYKAKKDESKDGSMKGSKKG